MFKSRPEGWGVWPVTEYVQAVGPAHLRAGNTYKHMRAQA